MNRIRVISTKIPNNLLGSVTGIIEYQNELTIAVRSHNGFITSKSYWLDNNTESYYKDIYNISVWKSKYDWNKWYNSENRTEINERYYQFVEKEDNIVLTERKLFNDIPLL